MTETVIRIEKLEDTLQIQGRLLALRPELEKGKVFDCTIKEHKERRSLDANAYFHLLVNKIAEKMKLGADEVKVKMNLEYGTPAKEIDDNVIVALPSVVAATKYYPYAKWVGDFTAKNGKAYSQYLLYKQTHTLDTAEMARLIDGVIQEAKDLGIETMNPLELENLAGYSKNIKEGNK